MEEHLDDLRAAVLAETSKESDDLVGGNSVCVAVTQEAEKTTWLRCEVVAISDSLESRADELLEENEGWRMKETESRTNIITGPAVGTYRREKKVAIIVYCLQNGRYEFSHRFMGREGHAERVWSKTGHGPHSVLLHMAFFNLHG